MSASILSPDDRLDLFDTIRVHHELIDETRARVRSLLLQTEKKRLRNPGAPYWDTRSDTDAELWLLPILGPSGSTKSSTIRIVLDEIYAAQSDRAAMPVRYLKLNSSIKTTRQLQVRILEMLSSEEAAELAKGRYYSEPKANGRLRDLAREQKTALIILDEAHSMLRETTVERMATGLQSLLNHGVFSIVLLATDEIRPLFRHSELRSRCEIPLELGPPAKANPTNCVRLFQFAEELCTEMHRLGVIDRPFRPTSTITECAALYDMTGGALGQVSRHFRRGLQHAFSRNLRTLNWSSIQFAFAHWLTLPDAHAHDPFNKGPLPSTMAAVKSIHDGMRKHAPR